ncbi:AMP-binding protein [Ruminiclostridium herbifermentans]|uniref:AMP-binding protein n=1 Tax=Ruminiclostridium herbifermentans TaxID=2488810 RepID=A0A7H1VRF0_9FIRM|nr:AMP-binding protein [Ruminiclostridium herbifermentans]QNU67962.1 AMP-binding protein [Ruminiclostridium herbifermentans]
MFWTIPNTEARIIDKDTGADSQEGQLGELIIRSPNCMLGYYKKEYETSQALDKDGWLHTGDLASKTTDGFIKIDGRIKDIIIRGGENISPTEIEVAMCEVDGVFDAKVVGVYDEVMGEKIAAAIISNSNVEDLCQQIETTLENKISRNKMPEYYFKVDSYPVNSNGKVVKNELKKIVHRLIAENKFKERESCLHNSKRKYRLYQ